MRMNGSVISRNIVQRRTGRDISTIDKEKKRMISVYGVQMEIFGKYSKNRIAVGIESVIQRSSDGTSRRYRKKRKSVVSILVRKNGMYICDIFCICVRKKTQAILPIIPKRKQNGEGGIIQKKVRKRKIIPVKKVTYM